MAPQETSSEIGAAGQPPSPNPQLQRPYTSSSSFALSFNLPESRPASPDPSVFSEGSQRTMSSSSSRPDVEARHTADMAERDYFGENPAPRTLEEHSTLAENFISYHSAAQRRVVLVTSGGTTVPLERQTVRFIDNFSAGTRGATSAEYFLEAGYAVIFLHRQFSLLPYSRHYSHATNCFLDFLHESQDGDVVANEEYLQEMVAVLRKYNSAKSKNLLLMLPFTTINDYLFVLRSVSQLMRPLGPNGLLYLAAAVSDFFVPPERMVEHKIQSTNATDTRSHLHNSKNSENAIADEEDEAFDNFDADPRAAKSKSLVIDLDPVPKFLKNLVDGWAPEGMIVSFKLETDPEILVHKAQHSLERYQHHLVIGNLLSTRKWEVVFISKDPKDGNVREEWIRVPMHRRTKSTSGIQHMVGQAAKSGRFHPTALGNLPEGDPTVEIESLIIPAVDFMHSEHIKRAAEKKSKVFR